MKKHIGIIAVSSEGSALCYREIQRQARRVVGSRRLPTVTLHNVPFDVYVEASCREDWHKVAELLLESARLLAQCGAAFCVVPDNVIQYAIPLCEADSPIPFLNMAELVADAVQKDGRKRVGVIGTSMVMSGTMYQVPLGLRGVELLPPEEDSAMAIDEIIFGELAQGIVRVESQRRLVQIIAELASKGCEGVILGCSEAPLVITEQNSPIPVYDATTLLAHGAVRAAAGEVTLDAPSGG